MTALDLLCSAIATKEGFYVANALPATNHNPGDLRASPLPRAKDAHGFVQFASDAEGITALYHQVTLMALRGLTPRQIITAWAPPTGPDGGNNTDKYVSDVQSWTGLNMDDKLYNSFKVQNLYLPHGKLDGTQ